MNNTQNNQNQVETQNNYQNMNHGLNITTYDEKGFKDMVMNEHVKGGFTNDYYRMTVDFSTRKSAVDFIGVSLSNQQGEIVAFCGMEVFIGRDDLVGYAHCLGVPKQFRGNGFSYIVIQELEKLTLQKQPKVTRMLTVCNEIGQKIYEKLGYKVTNPGWENKLGTVMQIRLEKDFISNMDNDDTHNNYKPMNDVQFSDLSNQQIQDVYNNHSRNDGTGYNINSYGKSGYNMDSAMNNSYNNNNQK